MINRILDFIERKLHINKAIRENEAAIDKFNEVALNGEGGWMLTVQKKNEEAAQHLECVCVEKREGA